MRGGGGRELLIQTAERMGKNVFVVTEAYTLVPKEALRRSPRREAIVMTHVGGIR